MGIAHKDGHCPQRWALPTKMGIAHKNGHCPQKWALPTKMGIALVIKQTKKFCINTQHFGM